MGGVLGAGKSQGWAILRVVVLLAALLAVVVALGAWLLARLHRRGRRRMVERLRAGADPTVGEVV